jgi:hypothetical protein
MVSSCRIVIATLTVRLRPQNGEMIMKEDTV